MRWASDFGRAGTIHNAAIEDIRIIATVLLVTYHVIGQPDSGLHLQYPHGLRFAADLLANFRMPAFAFIAGFIYCLRPTRLDSFDSFIEGKLRRLAVPGIIAALIFVGMSNLIDGRFAIPPMSLWQILAFPYAHYWFIQAILVLFLVIGLADAALRNRGEFILFGVTVLFALSGLLSTPLFSINHAIWLAPSFTFGMCVYRHGRWIERHVAPITVIAAGLFGLALGYMVLNYRTNPLAPAPGGIVLAMAFGMSLCMLMLLHLPHHPRARALVQFSFTIYLYHVFATSGTRTALLYMGITSLAVNILLGVTAGLVLPMLLHWLAARSPVTAALFLGIKRKGKLGTSEPEVTVTIPAGHWVPVSVPAVPVLNEKARDPQGTARFLSVSQSGRDVSGV